MSLLVWLPLTDNFENKGLSNVTVTNTNVTIDRTDANLGGCGCFNGKARIQITLPTELKTLKNTTVSAWVKCSGTTIVGGISHNGSAGQNSMGCCTLFNTGWQFNKSGSWVYVGSYTNNTNWKHVAVTVGDDTITTYMNGSVTATSSITSQSLFTNLGAGNFIEIGSDFPGGDEFLTGRICDFRVYDHALSKREIKELSKGLCLHVPLDWGANPNMVKNSYTFMNKNAGASNQWTNSGLTYASSLVIEDDTAPTKWVLKRVITNAKETNVGGSGCFYGIGAQGLATTDLVEGETYTYSFWAKSDSGVPSGLGAGAICESQTHVSHTGFGALDSNWRKHTVTFNWTKTTKLTACFYVTVPASSTIDFQVCGFKLEKGSVATPYIPHVEEAAYTSNGYATMFVDECSGYNRAVTKVGTAVVAEGSPRGTGTYMTSGCYVQTSNGFPINSTIPIWTITMWFKPDIGQTFTRYSDPWRFWINTEAGNNTIFRLEAENTAATRYQMFYQNSGQGAYGGTVITNITEKTWYHIAFTFDGTNIYQYVNGSEVSHFTINSGFKPTGTTGYFRVGDSGMYASFADVRIYATALSADDIKALYNICAEIDNSGKVYCNNLVEM